MVRWICVGIGVLVVAALAVYGLSVRNPVHVSPLARDVALALGDGSTVLDARSGDLDSDGEPEVVAVTCRRREGGRPLGGEIVILRQADGELKPVWRQGKMNPWKLQLGDMDGNGSPEVIVGVWKKSPLDQVMAKRTFVYNWNGKRLCPRWLASRLSRRFDDFAVADVDGDGGTEIVALEVASEGKHRISVYRWKSFGCAWAGSSEDIEGIGSLDAEEDVVTAGGGEVALVLQYRDGKVSLSEEMDGHDK